MPSLLSKILMPEWNVPYNCYELGHTWTPICTEAALQIGVVVFHQAIKLYAPLYLVNQMFHGKLDRASINECIRSILRSSAFLGLNAFLVILLFCFSRHLLGRFYYSLCAYLPSFFGSLLAIMVERPSRRRALAFYVANIGSETFYRIMVARGYVRPIKHGQLLMYAIAVSVLLCLYDRGSLEDPLIRFVCRLVLGDRKPAPPPSVLSHITGWWSAIKNQLPVLSWASPSCNHHHPGRSCFEAIILNGLVKSFALGWLSQVAWRAISQLMAGRITAAVRVFRSEELFSRRYTEFGIFLATFTAVYTGTRCCLCHSMNGSTDNRPPLWHSIVGSLAASPAILVAGPSSSMTLYLVWKSVEALFNFGIRRGHIGWHRFLVPLLYAAATSQLFYTAILDPRHMKPSYKRFLDRVTLNHLNHINRNVLEVFGTNASHGYESFSPMFDLRHTTKRFQESVLVWLL